MISLVSPSLLRTSRARICMSRVTRDTWHNSRVAKYGRRAPRACRLTCRKVWQACAMCMPFGRFPSTTFNDFLMSFAFLRIGPVECGARGRDQCSAVQCGAVRCSAAHLAHVARAEIRVREFARQPQLVPPYAAAQPHLACEVTCRVKLLEHGEPRTVHTTTDTKLPPSDVT